MANIGDLFLRILANTDTFRKDIVRQAEKAGADASRLLSAELGRGLSRTATDIGRQLSTIGQNLGKLGRSLTTNLTLPLVAAGGAAAVLALNFDTSLRRVVGLTDVTADQIDGIREKILALGPEVGAMPQELAEAFYFIASAGFEANEAFEVLEVSARAAAAGLGETQTIAQVLGSVINAYGKENIDAARAADILTEAVSQGTAESTEFANVVGRVVPIAASLGVSFDQVSAALAGMTLSGVDADEAATSLRQILVSLLKPANEAEAALSQMGLSSEQLRRQLREEGLLATLRTLEERFAGNEAAAGQVFGNVRALAGVSNLLGLETEQLNAIFEKVNDSVGRLGEAYEETEGPQRELDRAMASMQATAIELGADVLPLVVEVLQEIAKGARALGDWWRSLDQGTQKTVVQLLAMVAVGGPLIIILGKLVGALGAVFKVVGFLAGANGIGRLVGALRLLNAASLGALGPLGLVVAAVLALKEGLAIVEDEVGTFSGAMRRLATATGQHVSDVARQLRKWSQRAGIELDEFTERVEDYMERTGASFMDAVKAVSDGADQMVESGNSMNVRWAEAWLRVVGTVKESGREAGDAAADVPELVGRVLEDGSIVVERAAEEMVDPVADAVAGAREAVADEARGIIDALQTELAEGPEQIKDEMEAIVDALTDPYTEAERLIDLRANLMNQALVDALTSDDPRLEAETFDKINEWLRQWELLQPGAYEAGSKFNPALNAGIASNLEAALQWVQDNVTGPYTNKFDLAAVLEALGYNGLAAYTRGQATAQITQLWPSISRASAEVHRRFDIDLRGEGEDTINSFTDGLNDGKAYLIDTLGNIVESVKGHMEFAQSPPYTVIRKIGANVGRYWIEEIIGGIRAAGAGLIGEVAGVGRLLAVTPSLSGVAAYSGSLASPMTAVGAAPVAATAGSTVNNYNLHVSGDLAVDEAKDALDELRRLQTMSLRST